MKLLAATYRALLTSLVLAWINVGPAAQAHESRPAYLEIKETAPGKYAVYWRTPVLAGARLPVIVKFPESVRNLKEPLIQHLSDSVLERRWIDAGENGLAGSRISFPGLELTITDSIVRVNLIGGRQWMGVARPARPWVELDKNQGNWSTALDFVRQGIKHILSGADHLLFVFGLMLLVKSPWMLVKTITAFTVAHSITLAAATLGYVTPPVTPVEAAIALSIVFLGVEIVRAYRGGTSLAIRHPWIVAFFFGLLHGFGFAGALSHIGLPPSAVPLALVSFNIGVEIGQLVFVVIVLALAQAIRKLGVVWPRWAELVPAYAVGSLGAFWMVQRLAFGFV